MLNTSVLDMSLKITNLKIEQHLPGTNELNLHDLAVTLTIALTVTLSITFASWCYQFVNSSRPHDTSTLVKLWPAEAGVFHLFSLHKSSALSHYFSTITWSNADSLSISPLETKNNKIWIVIQQFSFKKMRLSSENVIYKTSSILNRYQCNITLSVVGL